MDWLLLQHGQELQMNEAGDCEEWGLRAGPYCIVRSACELITMSRSIILCGQNISSTYTDSACESRHHCFVQYRHVLRSTKVLNGEQTRMKKESMTWTWRGMESKAPAKAEKLIVWINSLNKLFERPHRYMKFYSEHLLKFRGKKIIYLIINCVATVKYSP